MEAPCQFAGGGFSSVGRQTASTGIFTLKSIAALCAVLLVAGVTTQAPAACESLSQDFHIGVDDSRADDGGDNLTMAQEPAPVPEPSVLALLGAGCVVVLLRRSRWRCSARLRRQRRGE